MRYGWNLQLESWKDLSACVSGLAWKRVPFDKIHSSAVVKEPGIYLICGGPPTIKSVPFNGFFNVLYAGLSKTSIRSRFLKHCTDPDDGVQLGKRCYGFIGSQMSFLFTSMDADSVVEAERLLIDCFGPPCNRQSGIIKATLGVERPAG